MMGIFNFGVNPSIDVRFENAFTSNEVYDGTNTEPLPIFRSTDDIKGQIVFTVPDGKRVDHIGIKVELIGVIELPSDKGGASQFTSRLLELDEPGQLTGTKSHSFNFVAGSLRYESYFGTKARLRYFLRVTATRQYSGNLIKDQEILVVVISETKPDINNSIKMEVGIEECLHIEFEYDKSKYHIRDVVIGKINFMLVRIKIKCMELAIVRSETIGRGDTATTSSETLRKFEIMDGAPVKGESIPVRMFLSGCRLSPTFKDVADRFSVRYYLNLVLVDKEDRRYFKQQEIQLWRKGL